MIKICTISKWPYFIGFKSFAQHLSTKLPTAFVEN